jgi:hypothetical protein
MEEKQELFYIQDSRSYVGNAVLWWGLESKGYTTDPAKAQKYTREQAEAQHRSRKTDIPWPCEYVDTKIKQFVDSQYLNREKALIQK